jgi:hypothetical protein
MRSLLGALLWCQCQVPERYQTKNAFLCWPVTPQSAYRVLHGTQGTVRMLMRTACMHRLTQTPCWYAATVITASVRP